jgi:hypothetical protein
MTIQIYHKDGEFCVWAEPEEGDRYLGLCIGAAETEDEALEDAKKALNIGLLQVHGLLGMKQIFKNKKEKACK